MAYVTGLNYKRIKYLIDHNIGLYTAHLPLDTHGDYGNNVQLFKLLGLQNPKPFGYTGHDAVGLRGEITEQPLQDFVSLVEEKLKTTCTVWDFGKKSVRTVAILSGRGASWITEALHARVDVYLTGEVVHDTYHAAKDGGMNVIAAGHHNTETVGLHALSTLLQQKFNIDTEFIPTETGL